MAADAEQLRRDGHQIEKWSLGWLLLSLSLWAWFGYRFLRDDDRGLLAGAGDGGEGRALVGILALAVIPTIITAATLVYARVLFRLAGRAS
ncbi:hypothetical protein [Streptomyces sp. NPDC001500]